MHCLLFIRHTTGLQYVHRLNSVKRNFISFPVFLGHSGLDGGCPKDTNHCRTGILLRAVCDSRCLMNNSWGTYQFLCLYLKATEPVYWYISEFTINYFNHCSHRPLTSTAWSRDHATSSVTTVLSMLWYSLPEQLRQLDITLGQFKWSLKMFTFG